MIWCDGGIFYKINKKAKFITLEHELSAGNHTIYPKTKSIKPDLDIE